MQNNALSLQYIKKYCAKYVQISLIYMQKKYIVKVK